MDRLRIEIIGVGEAFDPVLGNSSAVVYAPGNINLLVDCGYAVPRNLFAAHTDPEFIDAIYFTHLHADHSFGFPGLIGRLRGDKRKKPLTVIGQSGTKKRLEEIFELAYPASLAKTPFQIEFIEFKDDWPELEWRGLKLEFAELQHPLRNFGIRIEAGQTAVGISGDGSITPASRKLLSNVDVLVHEAFQFERTGDPAFDLGHSNVCEVVELVTQAPRIKTAALVHMRRSEREESRRKLALLLSKLETDNRELAEFRIPEPGDYILS